MAKGKNTIRNESRPAITPAPYKRKRGATSLNDVTERKSIEDLQQSQERYKTIVETSLDGIYQVDTSGNFIFINESFANLFGYKRDELLGKHFSCLLSSETLAKVEAMVREVLSGKDVKDRVPVQHKDGHEVPVIFAATPLKEQGRIIGLTGILKDITNLERAERAFAESEEWHRALGEVVGKAGYGIVIVQNTLEREAAIVFANDKAYSIVGYSQDEVLTMSAWDFFKSSEDLASLQDRYRRRQRAEQVPSFYETTLMHKNGNPIPVEASLSIMNLNGKISTVVFFKDITERKAVEEELYRHRQHLEELVGERTVELRKINEQLQQEIDERKQAEQALQESERYFRSLIESASEVVVTLDSEGTLQYLSPSYERLLGYKPEDPVGRAVFKLIHPDDLATAVAKFNELLQNPDSIQRMEVRGRHKDGSWRTLDVTGRNLLDDPVVKGIVVNYRDITERKQAEQALLSRERYFQSLIHNALDTIVVIGRDGIIKYVSRPIEPVRGYKPEEVIGTNGFAGVHPEDVSKALNIYNELMQNPGATKKTEVRVKHKDGSWRVIEVIGRNLLDDPTVGGIVANYRDITERKQAEEKLQELYQQERDLRQQLEEEIKRRIEFARALAHELKTPLTPLLISSQVLASEIKDEPLLSLARNISRGAQNLNSRIDELLDLAKGEVGMLQLRTDTLDIPSLLRDVTEYVSPVASSRNQSLLLELPKSLPSVKADKNRLRQVVLNLLSNALKFTPEGGKIVLRAGQEDANLIVEVEDNGPGIAPKEQQHIFEAYHRTEDDREQLSGLGLGLGLALCKMLVELHGGRIWVKSQLGAGSTFGFSLPSKDGEG